MLELALTFLRLGAAERLNTALHRIGLALFCLVGAVSALMVAFGCLVTAVWLALLPAIGPIWTPLVIGGSLAAIVCLACLVQWLRSGQRGKAALEGPAAELSALLRDHKTALLLGAAVAGIVAGYNAKGSRR
jgi:hypothetical protein